MNFNANDFSTALPADWEDRTMFTFVAPFEPNSFAANIVITKHFAQSSDNLEDFANEQTQMMKESLPGFEVLDYRKTSVNNYEACQQLHRFESQNGFLQQVQTFILSNSTIFIITGTATLEEFGNHLEAFRTVVENFSVTNS